jgi:hypothetical protein
VSGNKIVIFLESNSVVEWDVPDLTIKLFDC